MIKNKRQKNKTTLAIGLGTATFLLMSVLSVLSVSEGSFLGDIKINTEESLQREATLQKAQKGIKTALTKLSNRTEKGIKNISKENKVYANELNIEPNKQTISNNFFKNLFTTNTSKETKEFSFNDISNNKNEIYINTLGNLNLINTDNKMFFPNNHARIFETIKLLTNSYYYKVGYPESAWIGNQPIQGQIPIFYKNAYEKGLLNNIVNYHEFGRSISQNELKTILENFNKQYPNIININNYNDYENTYITRGELSKIIVKTMNIETMPKRELNDKIIDNITTGNNEKDIINKIEDTEILVEKGIINQETINNTNQIITRSDFIEILSNAILNNEGKTLTNENITFDNSIVDINYNDENILKILYAKQNGLLDYLLEIKRGEAYLYPERPITKHEVYYIVGTYTENINLIKSGASDQENINLYELSDLINNNLDKKTINADSKLGNIMEDINSIIEVKNIISNI